MENKPSKKQTEHILSELHTVYHTKQSTYLYCLEYHILSRASISMDYDLPL